MQKSRRCAAALTALSLLVSLTACTDRRPAPDDAAQALAAALSQLDLGGLSFSNTSPEAAGAELAAITAALGGLKPGVTVAGVEIDGEDKNRATATLSYDWDVTAGAEDWTYDTPATLEYSEESGQWQPRWEPAAAVPALAPGEVLTRSTLQAPRADILGAGGAVLVTERPVVRIGLDKTRLPAATDAAASAAALAGLAGVDPAAFAAKVAAAGPQAFVEAIVLRDDAGRTVSDAAVAAVPGGAVLPGTQPLAPTRTFARPVLGAVGEATAEMIAASGGTLQAGSTAGVSGLQKQFNDQLSGTAGVVIAAAPAAPAAGAGPRELFRQEPQPGQPLLTTLDPAVQNLAESVLADVPSASALVAVRPSDGAVLAAANGPGSNGYNTAMLGRYAPGSTFKVASSLGLLRTGATPATTVQCPPTTVVDGRTFKNFNGYPADRLGAIPLSEALAQSCNTAFINARETVPQPALQQAAASLGLTPPVPQPGLDAFLGAVPGQAEGTEHAANLIGQGTVLASPLGMATVAGSIARGGTLTPVLVPAAGAAATAPAAASTSSAAGPAAAEASAVAPASPSGTATAPPAAPLTADEAAQLRQMMLGVVDHGTVPLLKQAPGEPVMAKTGTAEYGPAADDKRHAWVIAIQGDLAISVFVEDGDHGSSTSGPLALAFFQGL